MLGTSDLFSFSHAKAARDEGLAKVEGNNQEWMALAIIETRQLVNEYGQEHEFTAEWLKHRLVPLIGHPSSPNCFGALTMRLLRLQVISDTGRVGRMQDERSHARKTSIYKFVV